MRPVFVIALMALARRLHDKAHFAISVFHVGAEGF